MRKRVERLLDQADEAANALDWTRVGEIAGAILAIDPGTGMRPLTERILARREILRA